MPTLETVENALKIVTDKVYHFTASGATVPYIVWAEDSQANSLDGDDIMLEQVLEGTIDLYTNAATYPLFRGVQSALKAAGIPFRLNSVQYEDDTEYIHHEWVFQAVSYG